MPSSESILPDSTTLMVVTTEPRLLLDRSVTASLAETEIGAFIDADVADQAAMQERLGIRLDDLMAVSTGQLSLGYVRPRLPTMPGYAPAATVPPAFFLTMDIDGMEEAANSVLDAAVERLISRQFKKRAVRAAYRSVCHLQISAGDAQGMAEIASRDRAFSINDGVLFAVDKMSVAKSFVDNLAGTNGNLLARSQAFVDVMNACNENAGGAVPNLRWFAAGSDSSSHASGGYLLRQDVGWKIIERTA